ncbi:MAG: hypothetical protein JO034_11920 [Singulisphaera sp.]|nr:hypothetical protein [Singulisphaera sp.]
MPRIFSTTLPPLPLLLWETPPGLELILAQEGTAFARVRDPHPLTFQGGRFVLYDGRRVSAAKLRATLTPDHVPLDVDLLRGEERADPFQALIDVRGQEATWRIAGRDLTERVARVPKARLRRLLIGRLCHAVTRAGGLWARLAAFPYPYQSAFNFRADLDEPVVEDYARFARMRPAVADCCTHFVSTHAYGAHPAVLQDLLRFDTQSHAHFHVIYRDAEANRRNLLRAHEILTASGFEPVGFAAPHGRWNAGLDAVLEELGYLYSSDFQLDYDDLPFFPWRDDRFSKVLQVPIHPICEGLFLETGIGDGRVIADYLAGIVRAKVEAREPAFVYGHPERRLGRLPEVLAALGRAISGDAPIWRVTLTEFARWWRWRAGRRWSVLTKPEGQLEVQFDDWDATFPLGLEVVRGQHVSTVPVTGPRMPLRLEDLAYERRDVPPHLPEPVPAPRSTCLRTAVRQALDWETVTPLHDLPANTLSERAKKGLRWWRHGRRTEAAR